MTKSNDPLFSPELQILGTKLFKAIYMMHTGYPNIVWRQ